MFLFLLFKDQFMKNLIMEENKMILLSNDTNDYFTKIVVGSVYN